MQPDEQLVFTKRHVGRCKIAAFPASTKEGRLLGFGKNVGNACETAFGLSFSPFLGRRRRQLQVRQV